MKSIAIGAALLTISQPSVVYACRLSPSNDYGGVTSMPVIDPGAVAMASLLYVVPALVTMVGVIAAALLVCWMMWQSLDSMVPQR
ncbi:MAG: hypothetical protein K2W95_09025 [Candidatus Obscuribacterales bacterium]|nr:hypothetical protein [Candidatus Obscuribacterales bacterium]